MKMILDASNIVYGGFYGSPNYRINGFPLGGVRKLLGLINSEAHRADIAVCFDGEAVMKKELLPTYKAGRVPNYSVAAQLMLLREILTACNIPYYWKDDLEADDYVCSIVHVLSLIGESDDIVIYSDDRDLSCCVDERIKLHPATSQGSLITRDNFEERVVPGSRVPYNTILLHKMIYGDKSDGYSGIKIPGLTFENFAYETLKSLEPLLESGQVPNTIFMDYEMMEAVIESLPESFSAETKQALVKQARIAFPQIVDVTKKGFDSFAEDLNTSSDPRYKVIRRHMNLFGNGDIDRGKFNMYCNTLGLLKCKPIVLSEKNEYEVEEFKNLLKIRAKDLSNGAIAIEYSKNRKACNSGGDLIDNMQLPDM